MRTVARNWRRMVRCNAIHPGTVRTPLTDNRVAYDMYAGHPGGTEEDSIAAGRSCNALKGTGFMSPDSIANAALFLNSALASTITGISLPVEAGHMLMAGVNANPVD